MAHYDNSMIPDLEHIFGGELPEPNQLAAKLISTMNNLNDAKQALRSVAVMVRDMEVIALDAEDDSRKFGNRIVMRKTELEERAKSYRDMAQALREVLDDFSGY